MNEKGKSMLPWILVGILFLALVGGGIYVYRDMNQTNANALNQAGQGQANQQRNLNPAMRAAMSLLRLQQDPKVALTVDQKVKLVSIIQDLKNTANPSQQFLQDKANAIEQVLTDDQKNFLNQRPTGQGNGNNPQWGGQQGGGQGQGQGQGQASGQRPNQGGGNRQQNLSDLYDRVLKALQ